MENLGLSEIKYTRATCRKMIITSIPVRAPIMHPAVQIYTWACLVLAVQGMQGYILALIAALLTLCALLLSRSRFFLMIKKTRWIIVTAFLIFSFSGSGAALWPLLGSYSPSASGVNAGMMQLLRLVVILASLSFLLVSLSQAQLMSGLNTLFLPISRLGFSREKLTVRLALTLHYVENALPPNFNDSLTSIEKKLQPMPFESRAIELSSMSLNFTDWSILVLASITVVGVFI